MKVTHRPEGVAVATLERFNTVLQSTLRDVLSKTAKRGVLPGRKVSK